MVDMEVKVADLVRDVTLAEDLSPGCARVRLEDLNVADEVAHCEEVFVLR